MQCWLWGSGHLTSNWVNISYANGSIAPSVCHTPDLLYITDNIINGTGVKLVFKDTTSSIGAYVPRNWEIAYHE